MTGLLVWVLKHQRFTLLVAVGTLVLTVVMYIAIPKGFFPLQDTGFIQAITEAGPTVSFDAMAQRQQQLAAKILQDPDVASLSSFIGVDGTNNTLNSGRFLINLKPKEDRDGVSTVMDRLAPGRPFGARHHLLSAAGAGPDHRFGGLAAPSISSCCRRRPRPR